MNVFLHGVSTGLSGDVKQKVVDFYIRAFSALTFVLLPCSFTYLFIYLFIYFF